MFMVMIWRTAADTKNLALICLTVLGVGTCPGVQADTDQLPPFEEIYSLIRSNLAWVNEKELNEAAVAGFLEQLGHKVDLVDPSKVHPEDTENTPLAKAEVYQNQFLYLRVHKVDSTLTQSIRENFLASHENRSLAGLIMDLRYAGGEDYEAIRSIASLFATKAQPILSWGETSLEITEPQTLTSLPLTVLINPQTQGAAEALAAVLRHIQAALLIGSPSAGKAMVHQTLPLSTGHELRIAAHAVQLPNDQTLPSDGVKPDITVNIAADREAEYFEDPYAQLQVTTTGEQTPEGFYQLRPQRRINEADLIRQQRQRNGNEPEPALPTVEEGDGNEPRTVQDPVLARAIDLLHGLSVVKQFQQP